MGLTAVCSRSARRRAWWAADRPAPPPGVASPASLPAPAVERAPALCDRQALTAHPTATMPAHLPRALRLSNESFRAALWLYPTGWVSCAGDGAQSCAGPMPCHSAPTAPLAASTFLLSAGGPPSAPAQPQRQHTQKQKGTSEQPNDSNSAATSSVSAAYQHEQQGSGIPRADKGAQARGQCHPGAFAAAQAQRLLQGLHCRLCCFAVIESLAR